MGAYALAGLLTSGIVKIPVTGCSPVGQLAAFIQQRIRHGYRRQRTSDERRSVPASTDELRFLRINPL
jgi:hypothetical protein